MGAAAVTTQSHTKTSHNATKRHTKFRKKRGGGGFDETSLMIPTNLCDAITWMPCILTYCYSAS